MVLFLQGLVLLSEMFDLFSGLLQLCEIPFQYLLAFQKEVLVLLFVGLVLLVGLFVCGGFSHYPGCEENLAHGGSLAGLLLLLFLPLPLIAGEMRYDHPRLAPLLRSLQPSDRLQLRDGGH